MAQASRCGMYFMSCTPMAITLYARSARASTAFEADELFD
jgi:hypothetical protein